MKTICLLASSLAAITAVAAPKGPDIAPNIEQPPETPPAAKSLERIRPDKTTLFLLEPGVMDLEDTSGHIPQNDIKVVNGEIVDDPVGGAVLRFGEKLGTVLIIQ